MLKVICLGRIPPVPFVLLRSAVLSALLASALVGCFDDEKSEPTTTEGTPVAESPTDGEASGEGEEAATDALPVGLVAPITDIETAGAQPEDLAYPYQNGFELPVDASDVLNSQDHWRLEDDWQFAQSESYGGQWHLLAERKNESAAYFKGAATLERFVYIPLDAHEPTLSFRHQLNLWKNADRVAVEVASSEEPESWQILKHLTRDEVTDGYEKINIDISDYIGKSIRFRLRFDLRGDGDTDRLDGGEEQTSATEVASSADGEGLQTFKAQSSDGEKRESQGQGNGNGHGQEQHEQVKERGDGEVKDAQGTKGPGQRGDEGASSGDGNSDGGMEGETGDRPGSQGNGHGQDSGESASEQQGNGQGRGQENRDGNGNNGRALGHERRGEKQLYWLIDEFSVADLDSDSDGISDYFERRVGTDPFDAQSVPADENKDEIPDVINALMGEWVGECTYLGGGEYGQVKLSFDAHHLHQHHISAAEPGCTGEWLTVTNWYAYSMANGIAAIAEGGSELDLLLIHSIVVPNESGAAEGFNLACSKTDFMAWTENMADGVTCAPSITYPSAGAVFYDRLRNANGEILLGNQLDQTDASQRAVELSTYRFIKTGL